MKTVLSDISIVVIGYDPYIDVWNHYFELLNKYWANRPATYLITNTITPNYEGVNVIPAGQNAEWSKKVQVAIKNIHTKYFILLLEDFFTTHPVNNNALNELLGVIDDNNIKYCKLLNQSRIKGKDFNSYKNLKIIGREEEYGISLQPSIWNVEFLKKIVGTDNYNAWIFEFNQIHDRKWNSTTIDSLAENRNLLQITHAVVQGKYLPSAIKVFRKQAYEINTTQRPVLSFMENFMYRTKCLVAENCPKWGHNVFKLLGQLMGVDFVSDRQKNN